MTILLTLGIMMAMSIILITISFYLPELSPDSEKVSPYECGFDPLGTARLPFSLRFFLIAILFILFDLEIALLLPLPWALTLAKPMAAAIMTMVIIIILTIGLVYEWLQGGLEWAD
uniref:NADH-ubiquinone oxidoreductase chain 3 n=1 Tax=Geocalamus acutus TaxID=261498 RepID=Q66ST3_GEOAC|nr:NADH dehydrogenase subunit 3 [Geocalamus acutus]AAT08536.1 NADH dehydrogenase subunit 3 [Geocalamus acutus]